MDEQEHDKRSAIERGVRAYYDKTESRWGYSLLLGGRKHFGFYPADAKRISRRDAQRLMEERLANSLNLEGEALVLDAGCGEGLVAAHLAKARGWNVEGIDLVPRNIPIATSRGERLGVGQRVHFQEGSYSDLPFRDALFDGVYTMETLVHAADYRRVLAEFRRVLKPGGRLALFEYTMAAWKDIDAPAARALLEIARVSSMNSWPLFHNGSMADLVSAAGFTDVVVEDLSERIEPMLRWLARVGRVPYLMSRAVGLQHKFVNAMSAVEWYRYRHDWRYVSVAASKPS